MKKFILSVATVFAIVYAEAQTSCKITGKIKGIDSGTILLNYTDKGKEVSRDAIIKDGSFELELTLPEVERLTLQIQNPQFNGATSLFAGNGSISLRVDTGALDKPEVEGSLSQMEYWKLQNQMSSIDEQSSELNKLGAKLYISGMLTEAKKDSLFKKHDDLEKARRELIAGFAKEYPSSAVSAWAIALYYGYEPVLTELETAFKILTKENQSSIYGRQIAETIVTARKTEIGRPAPEFVVKDVKGNPVSISKFRGKYLFLDFWASWCGPCRAENPNLRRVFEQYHNANFDILGISLDTDKEAWQKAVQMDKLAWTQVSELKGWQGKLVGEYGIKGIPFNLLLDKEGNIIAKNLRGIALEKTIKELVN